MKILLNFLKKTHDDFQSFIEKISFDKQHSHHQTIILLYCSIFEHITSCIILIDKNHFTSISTLIRTILEAYIDLATLISNKDYGYHLEFKRIKEFISLLEEGKLGTNIYLKTLKNFPHLDETIAQLKTELNELKKKGYKELLKKEIFDEIDSDLYRGFYSSLCCNSHNNLISLISQYIEISKNNDFQIVVYRELNDIEKIMYMTLITELLIRTSYLVHEFFNSSILNEISTYRKEFNEITSPTVSSYQI